MQVKAASGAVPLGATCAAGDQLMASWATGHAYLLLLERDGAGRIQVLFPPGGTASARLAAPRGATRQSFVLDEVPGRECFAAFFSDAPVEAARAGEALARGGGAPALGGAVVRVQCCEKEGGMIATARGSSWPAPWPRRSRRGEGAVSRASEGGRW